MKKIQIFLFLVRFKKSLFLSLEGVKILQVRFFFLMITVFCQESNDLTSQYLL